MLQSDLRYNVEVVFIDQLLFQEQPHRMLDVDKIVHIRDRQIYKDHDTAIHDKHFC